jgi:transposase
VSKRYVVDLTDEERAGLRDLVRKGKLSARKLTRAHVLLRADEGAVDTAIAEALHVHVATVERTRRRFVEGGVDWALNERSRPGQVRKLGVKQEAYLIALACSKPPEGRARWTLRLLADKLVKLEIVEDVSHETVRQTLKRGTSNLG